MFARVTAVKGYDRCTHIKSTLAQARPLVSAVPVSAPVIAPVFVPVPVISSASVHARLPLDLALCTAENTAIGNSTQHQMDANKTEFAGNPQLESLAPWGSRLTGFIVTAGFSKQGRESLSKSLGDSVNGIRAASFAPWYLASTLLCAP